MESYEYDTPVRRTDVSTLKGIRSKKMQNSSQGIYNSTVMITSSSLEMNKALLANTFSSIPVHRSSPSTVSTRVPFNPFNVGLKERLEKPTFSPSVFSSVLSPSESSEEMRWTIEDLSMIKPAPIEEDGHIVEEFHDPESESQMQEVIEKYFSETHMVPSPFDPPGNFSCVNPGTPLLLRLTNHAVQSTPRNLVNVKRSCKNASVQTLLSLPPVLPKHIETALQPYFYTADQESASDDSSLNSSMSRRKLFFNKEEEPISPVRQECTDAQYVSQDDNRVDDFNESLCSPSNGSSVQFTPILRNISPPNISPIFMNNEENTRARVRFEFSDVKCSSILEDVKCNSKKVEINECKQNSGKRLSEHKSANNIKNHQISFHTVSLLTSTVNPVNNDTGYNTQEDMSWRQCGSTANVSESQRNMLIASTPTK